MKSKKRKKKQTSKKGLVIGTIFGFFAFILLSFTCAYFFTKNDIDIKYVKYILLILVAIISFFSGFFAKSQAKQKGIVAGLVPSAILCTVLFLVILFVNYSNFDSSAFIIFPIGILSGISGGIISSNLK